jgi:DNA-binding MarR family transcriptional regulator
MTPRRPADRAAAAAALHDALQQLARVARPRAGGGAGPGGLTASEGAALAALERAGALPVGRLAAALGRHKSNASRIVRALARRRLVRRRRDAADRRAVVVELTAAGAEVQAALRAGSEARCAALLERLPARARGELVELARALAAEAAAVLGAR